MANALLLVAATLFVAVMSSGCGEKLDPTDPEGAYNLFIKALWAGDGNAVWQRLAPSTHKYFQTQYETLVSMDKTINKYLPPTDHKIAREQAGSILTDDIKDGKGLFLKVFKPKKLKLTEANKVGANVEEVKVDEKGNTAELTTAGGDKYYLSKGDKGQWFVMLVRSTKAVQSQMKWLDKNQSALKQTVEDLIDEERKERESVIAELMKNQKDMDAGTDGEEADGGQQKDPGNNGH